MLKTSLILRRPRSFSVPFAPLPLDRERPRTSENQASLNRDRCYVLVFICQLLGKFMI